MEGKAKRVIKDDYNFKPEWVTKNTPQKQFKKSCYWEVWNKEIEFEGGQGQRAWIGIGIELETRELGLVF